MSIPGEETRRRLTELAARWDSFDGSERAEAQTFLAQLLACYGVDRQDVGARFEEPTGKGGFFDMVWPGVCIFEMKRPSEADRLHAHRDQALDYWKKSGTPRAPAPPYVVLCAFRRFEVWQPGAVFTEPRATFHLTELPERPEALAFLAGSEPSFTADRAELTREAVVLVTDLYARLRERRAAEPETLQDFVFQVVWSMFAEDLQMLPSHLFTRLLEGLLKDQSRSSADDLGLLFRYLAEREPRPTHGVYAGTPYANGGLFARPAAVHLERAELELLREAASFDWKRVEPAIFGSLLEGGLGRDRQWNLGAHYTAEADIMKVILPTIVEPWRARIAACRTIRDVEAAQVDLMNYVVLDPACGSGNFLYVAYRELRRIEAALRRRAREMRRSAGLRDQETLALYFPLTNVKGIEIDPFAVRLARVTLWMGHKLAVDELDIAEQVLPLSDLSGIRRADALRVAWPRANAIVGNPPYHGSQQIRAELGDQYAEWLKSEFGIGLKDYAVYWFRRAHEHLPDGGRAGFVATNSVSQNRARGPSLEWLTRTGGVITNAVSTQDWPGAAAVDVSIVNWVKHPAEPPPHAILDGATVGAISPSLRSADTDLGLAERLAPNRGIAFQGPIPAGDGFVLSAAEAERLLERDDAPYADVVRPYLIGEDIAQDPRHGPRRYVIDFGFRPLEEAARYPAALDIVRTRVKPMRDANRDAGFRERWWQFGRPRREMRAALEPLGRYVAANRIGKRFLPTWQDPEVCPSDLIIVFALQDDYSFGLLLSGLHERWARAQSSTLEDRVRYTPTTAFETFPWPPAPPPGARDAVAELARAIAGRRLEICLERDFGLTALYNEVDDGAYRDLAGLHRELDEHVARSYGWAGSVGGDPVESNRRLLDLNLRIANGQLDYAPFASGGSG